MPNYKVITRGIAIVEREYNVEADSGEAAVERIKNEPIPGEIMDIFNDNEAQADTEWDDYEVYEIKETVV